MTPRERILWLFALLFTAAAMYAVGWFAAVSGIGQPYGGAW